MRTLTNWIVGVTALLVLLHFAGVGGSALTPAQQAADIERESALVFGHLSGAKDRVYAIPNHGRTP